MGRQSDTLAVIDLGNHRCCCTIADVVGPDRLEVIGIGSTRTEGIRKGVVVNLEALVASLRGSIEEASSMAGRSVDSVLTTIPAAQVRSFTSRGVVTIGSRDRVVAHRDLERVLDTARAVQIPDNQHTLHLIPQEYTLDGQEGIQDPVGMTGSRLEASVHVVTVPRQAAQHVFTAVERCHVEPVGFVFPLLASGEAVLSREEREQGVLLIDCGGGTTDVALFERGAIWFTSTIPVAGELITSDISIGLRTPIGDAERIKRTYASAIGSSDEDLTFEVATVGNGAPRIVASSLLTQIVAPRVQEIFELVRDRLDKAGVLTRARAGAVIVGGSANLEGLIETCEDVLEMPTRLGLPEGVGGLTEDVRAPSFATPVGLALWEMRHARRERLEQQRRRGMLDSMKAGLRDASKWIAGMF